VCSSDLDLIIKFPTTGVILLNEDATSIVEVSFNGNTVHEELNPALATKGMSYDRRTISSIWLRLKSGSSAIISVRAWNG
jgi:hypothetical protein